MSDLNDETHGSELFGGICLFLIRFVLVSLGFPHLSPLRRGFGVSGRVVHPQFVAVILIGDFSTHAWMMERALHLNTFDQWPQD